MNEGCQQDKVTSLFLLSNIAGEECQEHIQALVDDEALISRILTMTNHASDKSLKCEAIWVITNAIEQS